MDPFDLVLEDPSNTLSISPASQVGIGTTVSSATRTSTPRKSSGHSVSVFSGTGSTVTVFSTAVTAAFSFSTATLPTGQISTTSALPSSSVTTTFSTPTQSAVQTGNVSRKRNLAAIMGGLVGGLVLLSLFLATFIIYRRRKPKVSPHTVSEPLVQNTPTTSRRNSATDAPSTATVSSEEEGVERLRDMVQLMSERIMVLEAQQRMPEPVVIDSGSWHNSELQLPPPNYSDRMTSPPTPPLVSRRHTPGELTVDLL
ncbi:hypothetical protein H0H93_006213 [Arthromyces matolae]|nr:hypothetical protein H0H93_006213 [Arthromyces matolae]